MVQANTQDIKQDSEQLTEVTLKDVLLKMKEWGMYLFSKWKFILLFGIIGGGIGLVYALLDKPVYTAEITFVLEEGNSTTGIGQLGGLAGLVGRETGTGGIFQGDNILQLYRSRSMIEKTLLSSMSDGSLLIEKYIRFKELRKIWTNSPALSQLDIVKDVGIRQRDSVVSKIVDDVLKNYLLIGRPDKKLGIISVKIEAQDEVFAKEFVERLVENVNQFYIDTKTKKSSQTLRVLQWQTDSVRAVLNGAIYSVGSATDATPNINPARQILRAPAQRSQLSVEANNLILTELVKNLELTKMSLRKEMPLIQVIDTPAFPLKMEKARKLTSVIFGGMIAGVLTTLFLLVRYFLKNMFKEEDLIKY